MKYHDFAAHTLESSNAFGSTKAAIDYMVNFTKEVMIIKTPQGRPRVHPPSHQAQVSEKGF